MSKLIRCLGLVLILCLSILWGACTVPESSNSALAQNVRLELVDWHISGLWAINSPVAWVRITNYNTVPIKNITFEYTTFDETNELVDTGTFTIEDSVRAGDTRNFIELYLGLVSVHSESLRVRLLSLERG